METRMKRKIYLSGPMTGCARADYVRRFREAEAILRRHGYGCINPCRVWACRWPWIYRAMEWVLGKRWAYAAVLAYDLLLLMTRADGIVFLPNWVTSRGANIEKAVSDWFYMMGVSNEVREAINNGIAELEKQP